MAGETGASNGTHDDHHDHHGPEYLAHHFESTEQQYDAGKLGIWIFLVTEVLFFSGLFCAYTLYRYHNPEIFAEASRYLDTAMGAINTGVLLFSSLTMAWAVRCAQTEQRKGLVLTILATFFCAAVFLGIKAVEYTHKWDLGIFVRASFNYRDVEHHGPSIYLLYISIPFALSALLFGALALFAQQTKNALSAKFFGGMLIGTLGYFGGVGVGLAYEPIKAAMAGEEHHSESHSSDAHGDDEEGHGDSEHGVSEHGDSEQSDPEHSGEDASGQEQSEEENADEEGEEHEDESGEEGADDEAMVADSSESGAEGDTAIEAADGGVSREVGIFFSIYYFMTGLHGFHVLGGMAALAWIYFRALRGDFYRDYFTAVDNVGLYWHLVDLIWIYLFPLLYLIGG